MQRRRITTLGAFPTGITENVSSHTFPRTVFLLILLHNSAPMRPWVKRSQLPKHVSSHNWSQIPVPFLSSCPAEFINTGFESHCMDLEISVRIKLSRHEIFLCFSIRIAFNHRSSKFHCHICLGTRELQECLLRIPEDNQPGLRTVSNRDFLEMWLEITKKDLERYLKKLSKITFPFESILAVTQTQRRQHSVKHSAGMQFQILLQGQNIWAI